MEITPESWTSLYKFLESDPIFEGPDLKQKSVITCLNSWYPEAGEDKAGGWQVRAYPGTQSEIPSQTKKHFFFKYKVINKLLAYAHFSNIV